MSGDVDRRRRPAKLTAEILRAPTLADLELRVVAGESGFAPPDLLGPHPAAGPRVRRLPAVHQARADPDPRRERAQLPRHDAGRGAPRADRARSARCRSPPSSITKGQRPPEDIVARVPARGRSRCSSRTRRPPSSSSRSPACSRTSSRPSTTLHGVLVDVYGMGVLLLGESGIGKSECALDLDPARAPPRRRRRGRDPRATRTARSSGRAAEMIRYHMELRGHRDHQHQAPLRRLRGAGLEVHRARHRARALGPDQEVRPARARRRDVRDPRARACRSCACPSPPGRNLALLIEIAARNELLKSQGYDAAKEFARRVDEEIAQELRRGGRRRVSRRRPRPGTGVPRASSSSPASRARARATSTSASRTWGTSASTTCRSSSRAAARPGHGARASASSSTCAIPTSPPRFPEILGAAARAGAGHAAALPRRLGGVADPPLLRDAPAAPARRQGARCSRRCAASARCSRTSARWRTSSSTRRR